ncbi:MAG TPA: response regulator FixJ [Vitreimonas sp.]|jgi:two-component system response regulator FixJ|nr:response regulator FixJ [Vitreimonas sp.]
MSDDFVVYVVDDDEAVRDSLTFTLNASDISVVAYASALELLDDLANLRRGLIVTDVRMPGMTGLELVARLKQLGVTLPVIVLTGHADVAMAVEAMKAGVVDFIEKPFDDAALLAAVGNARQHAQGEAGRQAEREDIEGRIAQLTGREKDVFEAIVTGESNKSAALKLGISPRTVEIYRANVMEKMRARTLSDLVRMALLRTAT